MLIWVHCSHFLDQDVSTTVKLRRFTDTGDVISRCWCHLNEFTASINHALNASMVNMRHPRALQYLNGLILRRRARLDLSVALRQLHITAPRRTDGVYPALTEMRVKIPYSEALRKQREEGYDPTAKSNTPETPQDRDLTPKKMSESFHRVVGGRYTEQLYFQLTDIGIGTTPGSRSLADG